MGMASARYCCEEYTCRIWNFGSSASCYILVRTIMYCDDYPASCDVLGLHGSPHTRRPTTRSTQTLRCAPTCVRTHTDTPTHRCTLLGKLTLTFYGTHAAMDADQPPSVRCGETKAHTHLTSPPDSHDSSAHRSLRQAMPALVTSRT